MEALKPEEVNRRLFSLTNSRNGIYANLAFPDSHHVPSSFLVDFLKKRRVPTETIRVILDQNEINRRYAHQSPLIFLLSKSMIFNTVLRGELTIGNQLFDDATPEEIRFYLKSFVDYLKAHPNATIYYRDHQALGNEIVFRTSSIFSNEKTLLVKRNPAYVDEYDRDYFQVSSELYAKAYLTKLEGALSKLVPVSLETFYTNMDYYLNLTE